MHLKDLVLEWRSSRPQGAPPIRTTWEIVHASFQAIDHVAEVGLGRSRCRVGSLCLDGVWKRSIATFIVLEELVKSFSGFGSGRRIGLLEAGMRSSPIQVLARGRSGSVAR